MSNCLGMLMAMKVSKGPQKGQNAPFHNTLFLNFMHTHHK